MARRLEMIPTPKHGSLLNVTENELSALPVQCVTDRRFGAIEELREEIAACGQRIVTPNKRASIGNSPPKTPGSNCIRSILKLNIDKTLGAAISSPFGRRD